MIDALDFLSRIKSIELPATIHLMGDDEWIRSVVRKRIVEFWCGEGAGDADRLVGTQGAADLSRHFGGASLFSSRKVIVLSDPAPSEKGTPLSSMGKNQLAALELDRRKLKAGDELLLIETGALKATSAVLKSLSKRSLGIDASPPKGTTRRRWIDLMVRKSGAVLSPALLEAMTASQVTLATLQADIEKLALSVEEGEEASLELWKDLSQADPEATVWEIGDFLSQSKTGKVLNVLHDLRGDGASIHEILPALFTWSQQRLQIKSAEQHGKGAPPEGVHPFVLKKMGGQVRKRSLDELRADAMAFYRLDRISKQSLEDPELALEKCLAAISEKRV